jgi:hypothetical protein
MEPLPRALDCEARPSLEEGTGMGKSTVLCAMLIAASLATPACKRAANVADLKAALTEQNDDGSVDWEIEPGGKVLALVRSPNRDIMKSDATGTVTVKGEDGAQTVTLAQDPDTGLLQGDGPKLKGDMTEVSYALKVHGKDWAGSLYVPKGGTAELNEDAKTATNIKVPEGARGPHGGAIQIVGQDRVELVADPSSKEVRVYVLDDQLKPMPVGARKVKLAVVEDRPEMIVLTTEPGGAYLKGRLSGEHDPVKITISVTTNEQTHVALVGYHPGAVVVVGSRAPRIHVVVAGVFRGPDVVHEHEDDDDDDDGDHGRDHRKLRVKIKERHGEKVHINVH